MSVIMVTGGSGFVGSYVCRTLADQGHTVVAFDVANPAPEIEFLLRPVRDQIHFVRGQIVDLPTLILTIQKYGVERIFNAAAIFDPHTSIDQPYITYQVNVGGLINILEAARLTGVKRVVHSSSIGAYPIRVQNPMTEDHPIFLKHRGHLVGHYASSKAAGDIIGLAYFSHNDVSYVGLRYSGVYGYGMRYEMYVKPMVEGALQGRSVRYEIGGDMIRDYTHVKDVTQAVLGALNAPEEQLTQRVFNVASGQLRTASEVAATVRELVPGADVQIGPGLTKFERENDMEHRGDLDLTAAGAQLGYKPAYYLREGVADYIEMYRSWLGAKR